MDTIQQVLFVKSALDVQRDIKMILEGTPNEIREQLKQQSLIKECKECGMNFSLQYVCNAKAFDSLRVPHPSMIQMTCSIHETEFCPFCEKEKEWPPSGNNIT